MMKSNLLSLILVLVCIAGIYLPAQANDIKEVSASSNTVLNYSKDVRYVYIRGKRYKVWYKTKYRKGKRYVQIYKVRRA